jgi:hypothetical protein
MTAPLTYTLVSVDELVTETGIPLDRAEAAELLDVVHVIQADLNGLHDDLAECLEPLDACGRCTECGRLVARAHRKRGCVMAVPVLGQVLWLIDGGAYSVPFVGKVLWLWHRKRVSARTDRSVQ